jgi:Zn-dependent protease
MGWEDRDYNRPQNPRVTNPLEWILYGQVPLFRAFGISVKAHASLIILIVLVLIFGLGQGTTVSDRVQTMSALFAIILLHEFGHCFAARWVGGEADLIIMHPLGGLAFARPPRRPLPTFITVAGGPAVNVLICLVCGIALFFLVPDWRPWSPAKVVIPDWLGRSEDSFATWWFWVRWLYWVYTVSLFLFLFNLLPVYPLDGGQMLQSILWPKFGFYRSMLFSCNTGMVGAVIISMYAILTGSLLLLFIMISGFMTCMQLKRQLVANGPIKEDTIDYSAAYEQPARRRQPSARAQRRLAKLAQQEQDEQQEIDTILAKVSATGMRSLTWGEKRALRRATENQRRRDEERRAARKSISGT